MSRLRQSAAILRHAVARPAKQGAETPAVIAAINPFSAASQHCSHQPSSGCRCSTCSRIPAGTSSGAMLPLASCAPTAPSQQLSHALKHTPSAWSSMPFGCIRYYASSGDEKQDTKSDAGPSDKQEGEQAQETAAQPTVEELLAHKAELAAQVDKLTDQVKRALAEMENVRMRTARDVDTAKKFAVQGFVKSILDVADNLERAAAAVPPHALSEETSNSQAPLDAAQLRQLLKGLLEGVSVTERVLLNVFKQQGIEQYNPLGEKFDPNLHNALYQVPDPSKEVGTVAAVSKRGYKLHDRVIRPADVGVVRAP